MRRWVPFVIVLLSALLVSSAWASITAVSIAAGEYHTCALTSVGGVKCWGSNTQGQLGDNTTADHYTPADVSGLGSGIAAIAAGRWHTCAVTLSGGMKCWGANSSGQLGDGTTNQRTAPVDVSGLTSGVAAITLGEDYSCALTTTGGVKCWGSNGHGQLGDNTYYIEHYLPADVLGVTSGIKAISAGSANACALTTTGGIKCWGRNNYGQLGDNTTTERLTAVDVVGFTSGASAVSAGNYSTCALSTAGGAKCWGSNGQGQLGDNTGTNRSTPVDVVGLTSGVTAIAEGAAHTCALTNAGGVKCWGYNAYGQLGDNTYTTRFSPVDVSELTGGVAAIATGWYYHNCALTTAGDVKCWGSNGAGQLGDGTTTARLTPVGVSGLYSTGGSSTFYQLSVAASGSGYGNVSSTPSGISCYNAQPGVSYFAAPDCTENYASRASVTLTAAPVDGSSFSGWSGACTNVSSTCTVSMSAAMSVTATFAYQIPAGALTFLSGWNLLGNGSSSPIDVASTFSDTSRFLSVWKWVAAPGTWAFYAPTLAAQGGTVLADYATSRGYTVLTSIAGGEGFWINAKADSYVQLPSGTTITSASFRTLANGWNLISVGDNPTASGFNIALSASPPVAGIIPQNITTLWAWDSALKKWYFYAPSLDAQGGTTLSDYIVSKGYLNFASKTLAQGSGFWINKQVSESTLTIRRSGAGSGNVDLSQSTTTCSTLPCTLTYTSGTSISLTATPDSNSMFTGWSGACYGTGTCTLTMDGDKRVTAIFGSALYGATTRILQVFKLGYSSGYLKGDGSITSDPDGIICGTTCGANFDVNNEIVLTATPDAKSSFTGWSGACAGTGSCVVKLDTDKSVTATFRGLPSVAESGPMGGGPVPLTVEVQGPGYSMGIVTSYPPGVHCSTYQTMGNSLCTGVEIASGLPIVLTATAAPGYVFTGWEGNTGWSDSNQESCTGTGPCTVLPYYSSKYNLGYPTLIGVVIRAYFAPSSSAPPPSAPPAYCNVGCSSSYCAPVSFQSYSCASCSAVYNNCVQWGDICGPNRKNILYWNACR